MIDASLVMNERVEVRKGFGSGLVVIEPLGGAARFYLHLSDKRKVVDLINRLQDWVDTNES